MKAEIRDSGVTASPSKRTLYTSVRRENALSRRAVPQLLAGVALLLWTSVGSAVEESEPKVRLESRTKGARLSLARIGSYYWQRMSRQVRLTAEFVRDHLPPPRLRVFKWLTAPQK